MWFGKRRAERDKLRNRKDREIELLKLESARKSTEITTKMKMLRSLVENNPEDIAGKIMLATGGDKR